MNYQKIRVRFCQEASDGLGRLKGKTGITPNILARFGFSMSIEDPTIPDPGDYPPDSNREIDWKVLVGDYGNLFIAMTKERCAQDQIELIEDNLVAYFKAHMNRGALLLAKRVRSLTDLLHLLPDEFRELNKDHA